MKRLTVVGDIDSYTAFGDHLQRVVFWISKLENCHISIRACSISEPFGSRIPTEIRQKFVQQVQPEVWELVVKPPNFMPTPGKRTAFFSTWESSRLKKSSVELLNKAELVIVPCAFNANCFSANGVNSEIRVVPLGVDETVFNYKPHDLFRTDDCVVFGTGGRIKHGGVRKGINETVSAFLKAFPSEKDVKLKVKGYPDCDISEMEDPRIEVIKAHLTESEVVDWLKSLDCFVSSARCEGFGLWQLQALSVGRPVIASRFGGLADFMTPNNSYCVDYKLIPAEGFYKDCGAWALPSEEHMIELMRSVYKNPGDAASRGVLAMNDVKDFTWENSNRKLVNVLNEFGVLT